MHSKRRYKSFICSVILGELESFRNYKVFSTSFPKILGAIQDLPKLDFSDCSLRHILESENLRFPFSTKNNVTWVVKHEELKFRKS